MAPGPEGATESARGTAKLSVSHRSTVTRTKLGASCKTRQRRPWGDLGNRTGRKAGDHQMKPWSRDRQTRQRTPSSVGFWEQINTELAVDIVQSAP